QAGRRWQEADQSEDQRNHGLVVLAAEAEGGQRQAGTRDEGPGRHRASSAAVFGDEPDRPQPQRYAEGVGDRDPADDGGAVESDLVGGPVGVGGADVVADE